MLFNTLKLGVGLVSSFGASKIVSYAVNAVVPANISKFNKVTVVIGTWALGSIAGTAAWSYSDDVIDGVKSAVDKIVEHNREKKRLKLSRKQMGA